MNNEAIQGLHQKLNVYGKTVGLLPLDNAMPSELRVWTTDNMFGTVVGYVLSKRTYRKCNIPVHAAADAANRRGQCGSRTFALRDSYIAPFGEFQKLNGRSIDCIVEDGSGVVDVEGVDAGLKFAFRAENPDGCRDKHSILVSKLLSSLAK